LGGELGRERGGPNFSEGRWGEGRREVLLPGERNFLGKLGREKKKGEK